MARYIDADLLIDKLKNTTGSPLVRGFAAAMIDNTPTADVVEVVRCKDCKHYVAEYCTRDIKGRTNMFYMQPDDFCSYGERKDEQ